MNNIEIEENMIIVRWVWIGLNILLVIYAAILFIYAKFFRKSEVIVMKTFFIIRKVM